MCFFNLQVIEGMALGIGTNAEQTVVLIIALASHKWIEAFAFSASFVKDGVPGRWWIGILLMYSLMTPLGITGGIFLSDYLYGDNAILAEVCTYSHIVSLPLHARPHSPV